jgi:predicted nucleic acid-binding protein
VLALLLIFIAFGGKRRQRFVPEKISNVNTTVSYTETIGRLYLQKKDNRNIALKMFTYFLEHVRSQYYLNTQNLNNEFAEALSRKSGVSETKVQHLLQLMDDTDRAENISDLRLLELHNLVQEYFKK